MFDSWIVRELLEQQKRQERYQPLPLMVELPFLEPPPEPVAPPADDSREEDWEDDDRYGRHGIVIDMS